VVPEVASVTIAGCSIKLTYADTGHLLEFIKNASECPDLIG